MKAIARILGLLCWTLSVTAASATMLTTGVGANGGGYIPPSLVNRYFNALGDSRTAGGGGISVSTTTMLSTYVNGIGWPGMLGPLTNNKIITDTSWNYGIGANSSAGIAGRVNVSGNYCNASNFSGSTFCQYGTVGTMASIGAGASTLTLTVTGTGNRALTPNPGDYINTGSANMSYGCQISPGGVSGVSSPYTITFPNTCVTGTVPAGTTVVISPPSATSNFATYLALVGTNKAQLTDTSENAGSSGVYSPITDPAQVVFHMGNTNDANIGSNQGVSNDIAIFNALGHSGANKIIIASDEVPHGLSNSWSINAAPAGVNGDPEVGTIGAGPFTYTLVKAANYYDISQVFYDPVGSGPPFVAAAKDGVQLINCATNNAAAPAGAGLAATVAVTSGVSTTVTMNTPNSGLILPGMQVYDATTSTTIGTISTYPTNSTLITLTGTASGSVTANTDVLKLVTPTCVPASGQYSVNATTGVLTFNAADSGAKIAIYYRWKGPGTGAYLVTDHNWLNSTYCGGGTDPATGLNYKGASCPGLYPWVHVAATWKALLDPMSGTNYYNSPYTGWDYLHFNPYGGALAAQAMIATATAAGVIQSTPPFPQPTLNNVTFSGTAGTGTGVQATTCSSLVPGQPTSNQKPWFLTAVNAGMEALLTIGARLVFPTGVAATYAAGTTVFCTDPTNHIVQLSNPNTGAGAGLTNIFEQMDSASALSDGLFKYSTPLIITTAQIVNTTTPSLGTLVARGVPLGWTLTVATGVSNALTAGTLGFAYGVESNPFNDGYDDFVMVLQGYSAGGGTITLQQSPSSTGIGGANGNAWATGQSHRFWCDVLYSAGPNGHFSSTSGLQLQQADTATTAFTPFGGAATPGVGSNITKWQTESGGGSVAYTDQSLVTGAPAVTSRVIYNNGTPGSAVNVFDNPTLTPLATFGNTPSTQTNSLIVSLSTGDPVSAVIRVRRCSSGVATQ